MTRTAVLALILLLAGCATKPLPVPPVPPSPRMEPVEDMPPVAIRVPAKIRADLAAVAPKEAALVASPSVGADDIALVRLLHRNVEAALADLERDGGRHVTPAARKRAATAVKDLQNHLAEFQASATQDSNRNGPSVSHGGPDD